jgi:2-polyprenyl-6-hydroxyphenyl methylase/3-demethylubiquinone-9 3-methyltransferase
VTSNHPAPPTAPPAGRPPPHGGPIAATGTVDAEEVARFGAQAADWWEPGGQFGALHRLNPVRLDVIRRAVCGHWGRSLQDGRALAGLTAIDIGCGGGLVSEPLARMGAATTGIDADSRNIAAAAAHAAAHGLAIDYRAASAEALAAAGERFDLVVALEIVEHVADVPLFLAACSALVAPGGLLVLATINRTPKSFALAIVGAEYLLRWVPPGTHDWRRFVRPSELAAGLRAGGLDVRQMTGIRYHPVSGRFSADPLDLDVNYMVVAGRPA